MEPYVLTVTLNPALDKTVTVEEFEFGGLNRVDSLRIDPGGKGINVAKVLQKFGVHVKAAGFVAGLQGKVLLDDLDVLGIEKHFIQVPGETRVNLKIVEARSNITTEVNESGFVVTEEKLERFIQEFSEHLNHTSYLVLGGSIPSGVPDDIYKQLIEIARSKGVKTVLDADGEVLIKGIEAIPYAIKPNIYELGKIVDCKLESTQDVVAAARQLIAKGIELIVVSMGAEGAVVVNKTDALYVKTYKITPKSTVGAGDSMVATLVYSMLKGYTLEETARWVTTAGTVTASKPGTEVCSLDEVRNNIQHILIGKT